MEFQRNISEKEFQILLKPTWRLFLSVDLLGSTDYKNKQDSSKDWLLIFSRFLMYFPDKFREHIKKTCVEKSWAPIEKCPLLWKSSGDELIFYVDLFHPADAEHILECFKVAIQEQNDFFKEKGHHLGAKGTAWIAEFPTHNAALPCKQGENFYLDFIGPMIDAGFRLTKFASPQKLIVSVELAHLLLQNSASSKLYYQGREILKGVRPEDGYPIFWTDCWHPLDDAVSAIELKLVGNGTDRYLEITKSVIDSLGTKSMVPSIPIRPHDRYQQVHEEMEKLMRDFYFPPVPDEDGNLSSDDAKDDDPKLDDMIRNAEQRPREIDSGSAV